jgi:hypothetical protein
VPTPARCGAFVRLGLDGGGIAVWWETARIGASERPLAVGTLPPS